ncbi:C40 family peptidase [Rhizomonospora bruguierae]|uniref:C40 family peptidase n=1 Tax=Rhizomonospora bruguierae TaxID=1581705 RepID=UPI0020C04F7D|nr:C40 family peptidase [Micromonospora sp. NBRC 107566]
MHRGVLAGLLAALALLIVAPGVAQAEPSVAELERQIDAAWNKLEPVIEQHNATKTQLATKRKTVQELTRKLQPLELQVNLTMGRVGDYAAVMYKGGGTTSAVNALLSNRNPGDLPEQLTMLNLFAKDQQKRIQSVVAAQQKLKAQKAPLDALITQLAATEKEQAAREKQINAEIKNLQALRLKAYGTSGGIGELRPAPCPLTYPGGASGKAVKFACAQIGKTYVFGTSGPDHYDCSGLTMAAWAAAGVSLPHNAAAQKRSVTPVSRANLRPGDLVFYYGDVHHVGMYVGGDWIVHASRAGEPVRMRKIDAAPTNGFGRPS